MSRLKYKDLEGVRHKQKLSGIIHLDSGTYLFRDDHAHGDIIWAWNIKDDYDKAMVHKWQQLPNKHRIELFDIDNPPETVPYQPLLG